MTTPTIVTANYRVAPKAGLTIAQTSLGRPKWLEVVQFDSLKPHGVFGRGLDREQYTLRYVQLLADRGDWIERELERLLADHDGLVLGCWCESAADCHRSLAAEWIEHRFGLVVPELALGDLSHSAQLRMEVE